MQPLALEPGESVDHFRVRHRLGAGGFGEVWLARDTVLGRRVALKIVHRLDARSAEAFLREARVTARFSHPNIVTVYAVGEVQGRPYLALEYVEGDTLRQELASGRMPVPRAVRVAVAVARALAEAHGAGVLHRDLKPENVLLGRDGRARVVDFGLADGLDELDDGLAGTPAYLALEIPRGSASAASDLWALGVMLYEMLAGAHPYTSADERSAQLLQRLAASDLEVPPLPDADELAPELRDLPDTLLVGYRRGALVLWDVPSATELLRVGLSGPPTHVEVDGQRVVVGTSTGGVRGEVYSDAPRCSDRSVPPVRASSHSP